MWETIRGVLRSPNGTVAGRDSADGIHDDLRMSLEGALEKSRIQAPNSRSITTKPVRG